MTAGRRFIFLWLFFIVFFLTSACSQSQVNAPANRTPGDPESPITTPATTSEPYIPRLQPSDILETSSSDNFAQVSPQVLLSTDAITEVVLTPQPTEIPFEICSPLSLHPLEELRLITSDPYRPPPPGKEERHHGIDFSYYRYGDRISIQGVGVQAVLPGKVVMSLVDSYPYGNVVIIETPLSMLPAEVSALLPTQEGGESVYTLYAHMDQPPLVILGEEVKSCQALGQVGQSGNAYEPHLHLEMRVGPADAIFYSMGFYRAQDTEEERSNYIRWRTGGEFNHFDPMLILRDAAKLLGGVD